MPARVLLLLVALALPARADDLQLVGVSPDGSQVALIATTADMPRGFHEHSLEVRSVPDGKLLTSAPLVAASVRSRWARAGEFELYRLEVERGRREVLARVRELGFSPPLAVPAASSTASDPRHPEDPPMVATLRLGDADIDASVRSTATSAALVLRSGDRELALDPRPVDVVAVSGRPESVVFRWFGVREAWRDPAGRSLLLVVDTFVPVQPSFAARSVLVMAPLGPIVEALDLPVSIAGGLASPPLVP